MFLPLDDGGSSFLVSGIGTGTAAPGWLCGLISLYWPSCHIFSAVICWLWRSKVFTFNNECVLILWGLAVAPMLLLRPCSTRLLHRPRVSVSFTSSRRPPKGSEANTICSVAFSWQRPRHSSYTRWTYGHLTFKPSSQHTLICIALWNPVAPAWLFSV